MNDLGKTHDMDDTMAKPYDPSEPYYIEQIFDTEQMPGLEGKSVGDKVTICIECEVIKCETEEDADGKEEEYTLKFMQGMVDDEEDVKPTTKVLDKIKGKTSMQGIVGELGNNLTQAAE